MSLARRGLKSQVFAWIDSADAYGTIAELGYAAALHKRIWICFDLQHRDELLRDMWFTAMLAERVDIGHCPRQCLQDWLATRNGSEHDFEKWLALPWNQEKPEVKGSYAPGWPYPD
jgi:hypothetical protein